MASFIFVKSVVEFECQLPFQLTEKYVLKRASKEQVESIQAQLDAIQGFMWARFFQSYRFDHIKVTEGGKNHLKRVPLREDNWRFWVLEYEGVNDDDGFVDLALLLLNPEVRLGFSFFDSDYTRALGILMHAGNLFNFYNDRRRINEVAVTVSETALGQVERNFKLIKAARESRIPAHYALNDFASLESLPLESNHQILGCFSVIEALLTHNPNEKEVGDSLTHQLKTKLNLLQRLFARELDFAPFGGAPPEKIWSTLYKYRSYIAHGNRFDFNKDFKVLKSQDVALQFLREVTKLVILLALEKPQFLEDLKAV
jgi:hypothetical protein